MIVDDRYPITLGGCRVAGMKRDELRMQERTSAEGVKGPFDGVTSEWMSARFVEPWPKWAKRAGARALQILFPQTRTEEWEALMEGEERLERAMRLFEDARILGRFNNWVGYVQENLAKVEGWDIAGMSLEELATQVAQSRPMLERAIGEGLRRSPKESAEFFFKLARALESGVEIREQDRKALRVYLILTVTWPVVERFRGRPLKDLYGALRQMLPPMEWGPGEEEIDGEDRHYKWFENLCQRQLGLSLRSRGRRVVARSRK